MSDELLRQTAINLDLRRKLERVRRETVEYCAKFCEDNEVTSHTGKLHIQATPEDRSYTHPGDRYAAALRGIIRK